jgi:hypothetical protein
MKAEEAIKRVLKLEKKAAPGPWEWRWPDDKERSDVVYYEPFTDDSEGKGSSFELITRDSGVYGPDVPTCEFIMACRDTAPKLARALRLILERIPRNCTCSKDECECDLCHTVRDINKMFEDDAYDRPA